MLAPDVHAELAQLLEALQSRDNGIRSQAEEHLQSNWVAARPEVLLMGLAEQISAPKDSGVCPASDRELEFARKTADTLKPASHAHMPPSSSEG